MVPSSPEAGIEQTMQKGCTFEGYTQVGNSSQGRGCKGKPSEEKIKNIILISTLTDSKSYAMLWFLIEEEDKVALFVLKSIHLKRN